MRFFRKFMRKFRCLLERIRLSESEYIAMKARSQMYSAMMSTIKYTTDSKAMPIYDTRENLITNLLVEKAVTVNINITDMLAEGGIVFNKDVVKLNVTGIDDYDICADNVMCCDDDCQKCAKRIYKAYCRERDREK